MDLKSLAVPALAIGAAGLGAAFAAPWAASKVVNTNDIKNWWAPGLVAGLGGVAILTLGKSEPGLVMAGAAMAGAGVAFAGLGYANKRLVDGQAAQATSGLVSAATPVAPAALPRYTYNSGRGASYSSRGGFTPWSGVPNYSQRWAQRGGMPARSGLMPT